MLKERKRWKKKKPSQEIRFKSIWMCKLAIASWTLHVGGTNAQYCISALWDNPQRVETVCSRRVQFKDKTLFLMSPGKNEWASERTNERSGARERSEWVSGASERANGGANGSVLDASISNAFYPMCTVGGRIQNCKKLRFKTDSMAHQNNLSNNFLSVIRIAVVALKLKSKKTLLKKIKISEG